MFSSMARTEMTGMARTEMMARIEIRKWMVIEKILAATKVDQLTTMGLLTSAMNFMVMKTTSAIINQQPAN